MGWSRGAGRQISCCGGRQVRQGSSRRAASTAPRRAVQLLPRRQGPACGAGALAAGYGPKWRRGVRTPLQNVLRSSVRAAWHGNAGLGAALLRVRTSRWRGSAPGRSRRHGSCNRVRNTSQGSHHTPRNRSVDAARPCVRTRGRGEGCRRLAAGRCGRKAAAAATAEQRPRTLPLPCSPRALAEAIGVQVLLEDLHRWKAMDCESC